MHITVVRRRPGALVPLEMAICQAALTLQQRGDPEFHGYAIAKILKDASEAKLLTAYGTLYRALGRLQHMGLLTSRWEDPSIVAKESRPQRRFYQLTPAGEAAIRRARWRAPRRVARSSEGIALAPQG